MRAFASIPRSWLLAAALVFAAALILYTGVWLYYVGWMPPAQIGVQAKTEFAPYLTIGKVIPGSPAARAGLSVDDRILSINGYPQHAMTVAPAIANGKAGDVVTARIQRPGVAEPFDVQMALEPTPPRPSWALNWPGGWDCGPPDISCCPVRRR